MGEDISDEAVHRRARCQEYGRRDRQGCGLERLAYGKPTEDQSQDERDLGRKSGIFTVGPIVGERCQCEHSGRCDAAQQRATDLHRGRTEQRRDGEGSKTSRSTPRPLALATLALDADEKADAKCDSPGGVRMIDDRRCIPPLAARNVFMSVQRTKN